MPLQPSSTDLCFFLFFFLEMITQSHPSHSSQVLLRWSAALSAAVSLPWTAASLVLSHVNLRLRSTFTWTVLKTFPSHFLLDASFSCSACRRAICRNPELREFRKVIFFFFFFCANKALRLVCTLAYVCVSEEWRLLISSILWILTLTRQHLLSSVLICLMQTGVYLLIHCGYTPVFWRRVKLRGMNGVRLTTDPFIHRPDSHWQTRLFAQPDLQVGRVNCANPINLGSESQIWLRADCTRTSSVTYSEPLEFLDQLRRLRTTTA